MGCRGCPDGNNSGKRTRISISRAGNIISLGKYYDEGKKRFICPFCKKELNNLKEFRDHIEIHYRG